MNPTAQPLLGLPAAFTPGPWIISRAYPDANAVLIRQPDGTPIAKAHEPMNARPSDIDRAEANAQLIAASPDLLAVCRRLVNYANKGEPPYKFEAIVEQARTALVQATQ